MNRKIKLFLKKVPLMIMALFSILICTNNVKADTITINQNYVSGFFHAHKSGNNYSRYGQMAFWSTSNGDSSFCIEPGATFSNRASYITYSQSDYDLINIINNNTSNNANKINQSQLDLIKLYAFYGYGYDGHNTNEYRIATQMLIWRVVDPNQVFTDSNCTVNNCKAITDEQAGVADEMAEIQKLVDNHYLLPSFNREEIQLNLGESTTLYDTNNILSTFQVSSCTNCNATISGNSLVITATGTGELSVNLSKKTNPYGKSMLFAISEDSQNQVTIGDIDPIPASVFGTISGGNLEITKTSENGSGLTGATFKVYNSSNSEVCTIITDGAGKGTCKNLAVGNYTIREVSSPVGYILDSTVYNFSITTSNYDIKLNFQNKLITGNIELQKISSSQATDASLENAIYGIYDMSDNLITKIETDADGVARYEGLKYGNYYVKEIAPSEGHELDPNKYEFSISNNGETIKITSTEPVIKFDFSLIKTMGDGSSGVIETEANATFDIYLLSTNEKVATIKTNESGKASITLDYGIYRVCQTSGDSGTLLADCFTIDMRNGNVEKIVNNELLKAKIKVTKIDSNTGEIIPLAGIKFKIKNLDTDEYICQVTDKEQCVFETNVDGILITPLSLTAGHYQLEELDQELEGYLWNSKPLEFYISADNIIYDDSFGAIVELEFENTPVKGRIEIFKYGEEVSFENGIEYNKIPLKDITFALYDENWNLIQYITTNEQGYGTFEGNLGKYYLKEIETLDGYVLNETVYEINLTYQDQYTQIVTEKIEIVNYLKKGTLELLKVDANTGKAMSNVEFEIYNENDELIHQGKTNSDGLLIIDSIPIGRYYILEVGTNEGYILNANKIYFEITSNDEVVEVEMENDKINGTIKLLKTDESGNPLAGVKFALYDINNRLVGEYITDENGYIEITLDFGKYYLKEIESLDGYVLNNQRYDFEITEQYQVIEIVVTNSREIEVPKTATKDLTYILGGILVLMGIGTSIYGFVKKKKN